MPPLANNRKRKGQAVEEKGGKGKRRRLARLNTEIESESEIDSDEADGRPEYSSDEEDRETAKEKQLRLAKKYLAQLRSSGALDEEEDVSALLQKDVLAQTGKLFRTVAHQYTCPDPASIKMMRGHQLSVTCAVISPDSKTAFSASKDGTIIKWCLESHKKLRVLPGGRKDAAKKHIGHTASINCMAISSSGKFLATGDANNLILVWDPAECKLLHTFHGHRKAVMGLAFRRNTNNLYSASLDRTVRSWNLDEMALVESHHGTDMVAISALTQECPVTVGGRERQILLHNMPMETTRIFSARSEADCVAQINESHFIVGGHDSSLCLWNVNKKNPLFTQKNAHDLGEENWITAVASLQFTDLVASGSKDGFIHFWKTLPDFKGLTRLFSVPVPGFVNSLEFSPKGDFLLVGVGQEHWLGRWWRIKEARNAVFVIPLPKRV